MKLEKFKEKDHKKKITIGICILLVLLVAGIIVYRSFAFYEEKKAFDVIKGQVPDQNYDLMFSFYVKDENGNMIYQENMPEGKNYTVTIECNNGATGEWDYEAWGPVITNLTNTRTKCKVIFEDKTKLADSVKVGDYVSYTPSKTSYTTDTTYTGYTSSQTINPSELNLWRVIQITDEGVELVSEYVSSICVYFSGPTGFSNLVGYLNVLASQYETDGITVESRYLGYNGQTEYLSISSMFYVSSVPWTYSTYNNTNEASGGGDTLYTTDTELINDALGSLIAYKVSSKSASSYWIASRYWDYHSETSPVSWNFCGRFVYGSGTLGAQNLSWSKVNYKANTLNRCFSLRPIVIFDSSISVTGSGTSDDPWVLN